MLVWILAGAAGIGTLVLARRRPSGGTRGSRGSASRGSGGSASTLPPNLSGDPVGYNTQLFDHPSKERELDLHVMLPAGWPEVLEELQYKRDWQGLRTFQQHWNELAEAIAGGWIDPPTPADHWRDIRGLLPQTKGFPDIPSARALEVALAFQRRTGRNFIDEVIRYHHQKRGLS